MEINRRNLQWVGVGGTGATDRQTDRDREREKEAERERDRDRDRERDKRVREKVREHFKNKCHHQIDSACKGLSSGVQARALSLQR